MNTYQRFVVVVGFIVILLMGVFPPWEREYHIICDRFGTQRVDWGYYFALRTVFAPEYEDRGPRSSTIPSLVYHDCWRVGRSLLLVEWFLVSAVTGIIVMFLGDRRQWPVRLVVVLGFIVILLLGLFPPWQLEKQFGCVDWKYYFPPFRLQNVFGPRDERRMVLKDKLKGPEEVIYRWRVDTSLLLVQWFLVSAATGIVVIFTADSKRAFLWMVPLVMLCVIVIVILIIVMMGSTRLNLPG